MSANWDNVLIKVKKAINFNVSSEKVFITRLLNARGLIQYAGIIIDNREILFFCCMGYRQYTGIQYLIEEYCNGIRNAHLPEKFRDR